MAKTYTKRYIARVVIEAKTPLAVGSGENDITTDALVAKDVNGMPYIPGTSLAGIFRHGFDGEAKEVFGTEGNKKDNGFGSRIIFTDAVMIGRDGIALDGMQDGIDPIDPFYSKFFNLPIRQHVRIGDAGCAENAGKFDEQVIFKGTRFCFEMELVADNSDANAVKTLLKQMHQADFRIGSGTRNGFGEIEVVSSRTAELDLTVEKDLKAYLDKDSSLAADWSGFGPEVSDQTDEDSSDSIKYELELMPRDFFIFGSGHGDEEADMTPVTEHVISWGDGGKPKFIDNCLLIPATSVKGALAHRTAYYYNQSEGNYAEDVKSIKAVSGSNNQAVRELFGYVGGDGHDIHRGNVIFSDVIYDGKAEDKLLNHVSIDRFTGGSIDGALFTEKASFSDKPFRLEIIVTKPGSLGEHVLESFERALDDLANGMLPLGGGVNRGNGTFSILKME